jgi:hypothetical protein
VPLAARVLAIADAFDSLMSQFQSVKRSLRMVQSSSGTHFDPRLVSLFVQLPLHQEQSHDRSIACIPSTYPSGVGCALPLRAGEGASVPSEPPSPYHSLNKALRLPRKDERPRFR